MTGGRILLSVQGFNPQRWHELLSRSRTVVLEPDGPRDPSIEYAVVWKHRPGVLSTLPNLKIIFSVGAGVDHIFADPGLPDAPIVRVVAGNLTQYMTEYVVWRVLDHHRHGMLYRAQQPKKTWHEPLQRPAGDISVGIMGLGHLGRAAASVLLSLGFAVNGWSRTEHPMKGVNLRLASGNMGVQAAVNEEISQSELPMMLWVYVVIVALVTITYRDWRAVIACCLPLTFATFLGYWFMEVLQIGLTVATLPVMVLAVGIGVDYAFYIYNRIQYHLAEGRNITECFKMALLNTQQFFFIQFVAR